MSVVLTHSNFFDPTPSSWSSIFLSVATPAIEWRVNFEGGGGVCVVGTPSFFVVVCGGLPILWGIVLVFVLCNELRSLFVICFAFSATSKLDFVSLEVRFVFDDFHEPLKPHTNTS